MKKISLPVWNIHLWSQPDKNMFKHKTWPVNSKPCCKRRTSSTFEDVNCDQYQIVYVLKNHQKNQDLNSLSILSSNEMSELHAQFIIIRELGPLKSLNWTILIAKQVSMWYVKEKAYWAAYN